MKSGPHLKGCIVSPRFPSAAMIESVTVVLPTPLAVPAMVKPFGCLHSGWMAASVAILLSPMNFLSPPIREDQVIQWNPWEPSGNFQFRPWKKRAHISHAEIGDRNYLLGNLQHAPELSRFEDTHPSD